MIMMVTDGDYNRGIGPSFDNDDADNYDDDGNQYYDDANNYDDDGNQYDDNTNN